MSESDMFQSLNAVKDSRVYPIGKMTVAGYTDAMATLDMLEELLKDLRGEFLNQADLDTPGVVDRVGAVPLTCYVEDRKSIRLNSSHVAISSAVFCWKKNKESI